MKHLKKLGAMMGILFMSSATLYGAETSMTGTVNKNSKAYSVPQESDISCYIFEGDTFEIINEVDTFYAVVLDGEEVIYINKEDIAVEKEEETVEAKTEEAVVEKAPVETTPVVTKPVVTTPVVTKSTGEKVVDYAKQFIGTPYVSGGNSLTSGVDCSGFTKQVFAKFNINLQRSSRSQYASNGVAVSKANLKPGDLVFYGYSSITHVAIYIGNGQIIHAPAPGQSVSIAPLWQRGDAPIVGYKRVV